MVALFAENASVMFPADFSVNIVPGSQMVALFVDSAEPLRPLASRIGLLLADPGGISSLVWPESSVSHLVLK